MPWQISGEIMEDFEQLYKNQLAINESLMSHIDALNEVIRGQFCIPDCKVNICERCEFRKTATKDHVMFHVEQNEE